MAFVPATRPAVLADRLDATSGSGRVRVLIWQAIRELIPREGVRLWIGYGPESLRRLFPPHYVAEIGRIEQTEAMPDRAHNELLDALVAAGLFGAFGLVWLYGAVIVTALRVEDRARRAGLAGAAIAHVVEIPLGIATVMSRLLFAAVAGLAVAVHFPVSRPARGAAAPEPTAGAALLLAASVGAISPMLSAAAFRSGPSLATLVLYTAIGIATLVVARAVAARAQPRESAWPRAAVVGATLVACVPVSVTPSRADGYAKAGRELGRIGRTAEAVLAYEQAVRLQPSQDAYLTGLGRALIQHAQPLEGEPRDALLRRAGEVLGDAEGLNPQDPHGPRNLASLARIRARTADASARERLLAEADLLYARATRLAPRLPALWAEWGNVDAERQRFAEGRRKLEHATALDPAQPAAWVLLGQIYMVEGRPREALAAYDEALRHEPSGEAASRGRAAALAAMGGR